MLKFIFDNETDIPEAVREFYTQTDGKWILNCEGAAPAAKVDEFRKNNVDLKKKLDEFKDVDPAKYKELLAKESDFEASKADNKEKIDELVNKRVQKMAADHEAEKTALVGERDKLKTELTRLQIDAAVVTTGGEFGLRQTAHEDLIARARGVWRLGDDGKPVAMNGDEPIFGRSGGPITMKEWMEGLAKSAGHLFEENSGSGSSGGGGSNGGGTAGEVNPWGEKTWNLTQQGALIRTDPAKAKRLAAAAGKTIKIPGARK